MAASHLDRASVKPSPIHQLSIGAAFHSLTEQEKRYAHYMSRAAWNGTRIVLRQTSPEAERIFDMVIALHKSCDGDWQKLAAQNDLAHNDVEALLDYAACFLSNVGNYYGSGDQKFIPHLAPGTMRRIVASSQKASSLYSEIGTAIWAIPPFSLGFPSETAQSAYYPGSYRITQQEIRAVSQAMEQSAIFPENTRIEKSETGEEVLYNVLQASSQCRPPREYQLPELQAKILVKTGDHSKELSKICTQLEEAANYASNATQKQVIRQYIKSFETGDLEAYRDSQRTWVKDLNPRVENIFGFVEPYRDPFGARAEFEGLVAISDPNETKTLARLVEQSDKFIRRLPWTAGATENNGKGPFEKSLFEPPDFTSIHALAYCSSIIFPGINLPNYNDIRQECGFKNVIIANRMSAESSSATMSPFIDPGEVEVFHKHKFPAYYIWVVLHELLGHGTGKMMTQTDHNHFNFDNDIRPIDPLTGEGISSWYLPGQTWTGQFADLATTVDECRAELVGAYLMDEIELLRLFGFDETTEITASDLTYNVYLQLGVDGLRGLLNFNLEDQKWGQAHSRAHFAMLKCLLRNGNGFMKVAFERSTTSLTICVDRSRVVSDGKPALGQMLLRLHMYRCTANAADCRAYYEDLSKVDGVFVEWRDAVIAQQQPKWVFVQANTFLEAGEVTLKEYAPNKEGVIQSWAERDL